MLNLALVGLLAGSLASASPDGDRDKDKKPQAADAPAAEAVAVTAEPAPAFSPLAPEVPRTIIADTYSYGRSSDLSPIKLWVEYAYGEVERVFLPNGDETGFAIATNDFDIVSQRIGVGGQLNLLHFPAFKLGAGANLDVAQNKFQRGEGAPTAPNPTLDDIDGDFGLQNVKVYGAARGSVVGVHAGYIFDLGDETEVNELGLPTTVGNSDGRNALFYGVDFDYPSEVFRVFAGVDYYRLEAMTNGRTFSDNSTDGDDILYFTTGLGVRLSVFEIGAALNLQARMKTGVLGDFGSHVGTISPYVRIAPPRLPVSIFVKGAVSDEYTDYGYSIGGANDFSPHIGFTGGLTVGFQ